MGPLRDHDSPRASRTILSGMEVIIMRIRRPTLILAIVVGAALSTADVSTAASARITPLGPGGGPVARITVHPKVVLAIPGFGQSWMCGGRPLAAWASNDHGRKWRPATRRERATVDLAPCGGIRDSIRRNVLYRVGFASLSWSTIDVSTDGGKTFTVRNPRAFASYFAPDISLVSVRSGRRSVLIAGLSTAYSDRTPSGLRRSLDGGRTWRTVPGTAGGALGLWADTNRAGIAYTALAPLEPHGGGGAPGLLLLRTKDAGATWQRLGSVPTPVDVYSQTTFAATANGMRMFVGTSSGIFQTRDGGSTWKRVLRVSTSHIAIDPRNPLRVFASTDRGVSISVNGGRTWTASNRGLKISGISGITRTGQPSQLFVATNFADSGLARSNDDGKTWKRLKVPYAEEIVADPVHPGSLLVRSYGGLFASTDHGSSWSTISSGLDGPLAFDSSAGRVFATGTNTNGLWSSDDFGRHWTISASPIKPTSLIAEGGHLYALEQYPRRRVAHSATAGQSWSVGNPVGREIDEIAVSASQPKTVYAIARGRTYNTFLAKSTDGGATWHVTWKTSPASDGFNETRSGLTVDRLDPQHVFVGSYDDGLWSSNDGAKTWVRAANVPGVISAIVQDPVDPQLLYVGTENNGVWRVNLPS